MERFWEKYKIIITAFIITAGFFIAGLVSGMIFTRPVFTSEASYLVTDTSGLHNEIINPKEIKAFMKKDFFIDHLCDSTHGKFTVGELQKMVKVKANGYSPTFRVKVTCKTSSDVFFIQKTIESAPGNLTPEMSDKDFLIILINEAKFPEKSVRPGFSAFLLIFTTAGIVLSVLYLKKNSRQFIQSSAESLSRYQIPVVARIPSHKSPVQSDTLNTRFIRNSVHLKKQNTRSDTSSYNPDNNTIMIGPETSISFFDAFRMFCTSVDKMTEKNHNIILFTSAVNGDGKTTAAINFGITAAAEGKSVLLIDCNLRNRRLARAFSIDASAPGLYDIAFRSMPAKEGILFTEYHSLFVLSPGDVTGNTTGLLARTETLCSIYNLKEMFDYIIIDSPPVNAFADAAVLAEIADLNFFVVRNRFTPDEEIQKSLKSMELSEINISGFVLNDVQLVSENNTPVRSNPHKNKFISGFDI